MYDISKAESFQNINQVCMEWQTRLDSVEEIVLDRVLKRENLFLILYNEEHI